MAREDARFYVFNLFLNASSPLSLKRIFRSFFHECTIVLVNQFVFFNIAGCFMDASSVLLCKNMLLCSPRLDPMCKILFLFSLCRLYIFSSIRFSADFSRPVSMENERRLRFCCNFCARCRGNFRVRFSCNFRVRFGGKLRARFNGKNSKSDLCYV